MHKRKTEQSENRSKRMERQHLSTTTSKKGNKKNSSDTTQLKNSKEQQQRYMLNCEKNRGEKDKKDKVSHHPFNPIKDYADIFQWLIYPIHVQDFFHNNFEKHPVHIQRNKPYYYLDLVSTSVLDEVLREKSIFFTKNIDITSYTNRVRETHNPSGRAVPNAAWDYYVNKCCVRMLNPRAFIREINILNGALQKYFGCVDSNLYLTPPGSQGFASHYDDTETYVLQVEGKTRWRLYRLSNNDYLAGYSSRNFDESEIGEPILDTILQAGDLLYFPQGTIHQAETVDNAHSLHITLSVYQKTSWYKFFEKLLPATIKWAAETNSNFRIDLLFIYLRYFGTAHNSSNERARKSFKKRTKNFVRLLLDNIIVDQISGIMAYRYISNSLPPALTLVEQECSMALDGDIMTKNEIIKHRVQKESNTRIPLPRKRLMIQDNGAHRIYYPTENSKEYHGYKLQFLEIDEDLVPAVKEVIKCYPNLIRVGDWPIDYDDYTISSNDNYLHLFKKSIINFLCFKAN